jgi:two-component system, NtrC family, sensor histidine kinase HydH
MESKEHIQKEEAAKLKLDNAELAGHLAHEIKNPLSTIKINLQLISEDLQRLRDSSSQGSAGAGRLDEDKLASAMRKITIVRREADRLEQTVDNYLRFADKIEPQFVNIDMNNLVGDMVDFYMPQAIGRSIIIRHILYPKPLFCRADANLIKQALLNLFINAQHAMEKGGELMIRTQKDGSFAVIVISDTGVGMEQASLSKIFSGFSMRPGGRGLGLPIVKKIIDIHNGTIAVETLTGKGTSFTIKLPLLQDAD